MTPTIVLCECIVQRRYLFFVKLCFDNIMSIIVKVSYMKSNNNKYCNCCVFMSNCIYVYCLYKGEDVLSCETCIWSYCHVFGHRLCLNYINIITCQNTLSSVLFENYFLLGKEPMCLLVRVTKTSLYIKIHLWCKSIVKTLHYF